MVGENSSDAPDSVLLIDLFVSVAIISTFFFVSFSFNCQCFGIL